MDKKEDQSREVSHILDRTAARAFKMKPDEIIVAFDEAEKICLTLVSRKALKLEVKRRVCEWKLKMLIDCNAPFNIVNKLHKETLNLGYSSLENEGNIGLYFAQYCIRKNQIGEAQEVLNNLCYKIDQEVIKNDLEVFRYLKKSAEQLLSKT